MYLFSVDMALFNLCTDRRMTEEPISRDHFLKEAREIP